MLWLIGMMGSGKSSVGSILASVTGLPLVDTDAVVEEQTGSTIEELFMQGEALFREREQAVVAAVADGPPAIVATGGGAILSEASRSRMSEGTVAWLQAPVGELARRVAGTEGRPLLAVGDDALAVLLEERSDIYAGLADIVVDTDGRTQAQVTQAILDAWQR